MAYSIEIDDEILEITTSGRLNMAERVGLLKLITCSYDDCRARAIIVDHRNAEIICSKKDAVNFGVHIGFHFANRWPCLIVLLCNENDQTRNLVDLSIQSAIESHNKTNIQSFTSKVEAYEAIDSWLGEQGKNITVLP